MEITQEILRYAREVALRVRAQAVLVYADVFPGREEIETFLQQSPAQRVVLVTRDRESSAALQGIDAEVIQVPGMRLTRLGQIKVAVLLGLSQGRFQKGDRLICLTGVAEKKTLDAVFFVEVGEEHEMFEGGRLEAIGSHVNPEVFERVLDIAVALGTEGREGRPVGTTFVIGDADNVLQHSIPMVLNPFKGYDAEERNVLDPALTETLKEFAAIDGAFVIRGDGLVEAAGRYLKPAVAPEDLPWGLGTRHVSAAGITATTAAVAITVSASTGTVTVFREGRIIIEVERPRTPGPDAEGSRGPAGPTSGSG